MVDATSIVIALQLLCKDIKNHDIVVELEDVFLNTLLKQKKEISNLVKTFFKEKHQKGKNIKKNVF